MAEFCTAVGTAVVGNITQKLIDPFLKLIWVKITRVFKWESIVKNLKKKAEKLVVERQRVLQFTEAADRRGEEVALNFTNWLTSAEKYIGEMEKLGDDEDKAKKKCFAGLCPNPKARYQISKKVEEYLEAVSPLLEEAAGFKFPVSYCPPPKEISTAPVEGFEQFDSRIPTLNRVMEALRSASVDKIGIHGLPGVGKTMLAKEVARQAKEAQLFGVVVMASVKKNPDLKQIQGEIADKLGLQLHGETEFGRAYQLKAYLKKKKKILVILDDIWARLDLDQLGIPFEDKKNEASSTGEEQMQCKILLTSRDLNVLSCDMGTHENIQVGTLQHEEAWTLLKKIVGDEVENSELLLTAKEIAEKCAGLPLAIGAVAKALKGKDAHVWRDALLQLKRPSQESFTGIPANVYSAIELSYSHLEGKELQQTFLLCCLLGHNSFIEDLLTYGIGLDLFHNVKTIGEARDRVLTLISNLKSSSLLLDGCCDMRFDMHDIVRDVAISIALRSHHLLSIAEDHIPKEWSDSEALEDFKWIDLRFPNISELPDELECPQLTLFHLHSKDRSLKIPENIFRGARKLRVLDFTNMSLSSLPSSICLLKNLHTLHVNGTVLEDMAIIAKLTSLEVLSLAGSEIAEVPTEIGQLTQLKLLDLSNCTKLKMIRPHVLASLSKLEELDLSNSFDQWDVGEGGNQRNASLAELKDLHNLAALDVHVYDVQQIPKDLFFKRLKRYKIFIGGVWHWQDCSFKSAKILKLELNTSINYGHSIDILLKKAEELHLEALKGFKNVVYELEDAGFQELKYLHVKNAPEVQHIVNSVGSVFPLLEELFLQNLNNLVKICHSRFRGTSFSRLSIITVKSCNQLKNLFPFSVARQLHNLKEIRVMECSNVTEIVDEELQGVMEIANASENFKLVKLRSLQLQNLPKFIRLCHGNEETNDSSSNSAPLFHEKIDFPNLEELQLSCINIKSIWGSQLSIASSYIQSLTKLIIEGCDHLEHLLSSSMAKSLVQLRCLEIKKCKEIREIIEPENTEEMEDLISFPMLEILKIEHLEKHTGFCSGNCIVEFPALKRLFIENCPELKGFTFNHTSKDMRSGLEPLFNEKVSFSSLEDLCIKGLELRIIWHHQLPANSFSKLKSLKIQSCHKLSTVFPSDILKRLCTSLEELDIYSCCGVEEIFELGELKVDELYGVTDTQLRHVHLFQLPRLKHVCTRDPRGILTFRKLQSVKAHNCQNLQNLFQTSVALELQQLERLEIRECGIEEVVAFGDGDEAVPTFVFSRLSTLYLQVLPRIRCFYPREHVKRWPMLKKFCAYKCRGVNQFNGESLGELPVGLPLFSVEKVIPSLEKLSLTSNDIAMLCNRQFPGHIFSNVKSLQVHCIHNGSAVFPIFFLERFCNLQKLHISCSDFKELFPSVASIDCQEKDVGRYLHITKLKLDLLPKLKYIWKQGPATDLLLQNVKSLKVLGCNSLISLSESTACFRNLTTLFVYGCQGLTKLFSFATAQSLVQLQKMTIEGCHFLTEVVGDEEDRLEVEIVFSKLKVLNLMILTRLTSFCSRNFTFKFPLLEQVIVIQCPNFETFCHGDLKTPMLRRIHFGKENNVGPPVNDLNNTINQLYKEKVGYAGLQYLKLSEFPQLMEIWNRNPQQILDFTQLCVLEICNCGDLRYLLTTSMASSLVVLQRLQVQNCKMIKQIITEEEAMEVARNKMIFPLLQTIILQSCFNLTNFCSGSYGLEFPSLTVMIILDCPKIVTFASTFSTVQVKEAVNGGSKERIGKQDTDIPTEPFFSDQVAFPSLEELRITGLKNLSIIWDHQPPADSFCKLKLLWIESCEKLLTIFPSDTLKRLCESLEELKVAACSSVEEIFGLGELNIEESHGVLNTQLRHLRLLELPRLKHVWTKDPRGILTFQNLQSVRVRRCPRLRNMFPASVAMELQQLEELWLMSCGIEEVVAFGGEEAVPRFVFSCLSALHLWDLPRLKCFYPGKHVTEWPVLKLFQGYHFEGIKETNVETLGAFPVQLPLFTVEKVIPRLAKLSLTSDDITMICTRQFSEDLFSNVKVLRVLCYHNESSVFPFFFIERFSNLEKLFIGCSRFKELFPSVESIDCQEKDARWHSRFRKLKLDTLHNLKYIWTQGSASDLLVQNVESLKVLGCDNLISLSESTASFRNLTTLFVTRCQRLRNVFPFATAQSLVQLQSITVVNCHSLTEIVGSEGDGLENVIVFRKLKVLKLWCLTRLASFCSANFTFKFPLLEEVMVVQCPNFETFCHGVVRTPSLQRIQLTQEDNIGRSVVELNETINQLYKERVGYTGLQYLKLSDLPQLMEIWNKNPQEILDFKQLRVLEICNCSDLRYLLTPSMVLSLVSLKEMEVKNCEMMMKIITDEEATQVDEKEIILPLIETINLESCPNLISLCVGNYKLECPSLSTIKLLDCPKMVTFASTFSKVQVKEAAEGGSAERTGKEVIDIPIATFFSEQVEFSSFLYLNLSSMKMKQIFHKQLSTMSSVVQGIRELTLNGCDNLKYLFTSSMITSFVQLKSLNIRDCKKLKEVIMTEGLTKEERVFFPKLTTLSLVALPKLTRFCSENYFVFHCLTYLHICYCCLLETFISGFAIEYKRDMSTSKRVKNTYTSALFDSKVAFPCLEDLQIHHMERLRKIWDDQLDASSFHKLLYLGVDSCEKLLNVFPVTMLERLQNLNKLEIKNCASIDEIFGPHALSDNETNALETVQSTLAETTPNFVFPKVTYLQLKMLPRLRSIYPQIHTTEWPSLKELEVNGCNRVQILASELLSYQRKSGERQIENSNKSSLFWVSKATFPSLEELIVERNDNMKEIWHGNDVKDCIAFTKLKSLQLKVLPKLASFCLVNCNFEFPSLKDLIVSGCPQMLNFSGGEISTPTLQKVKLTEDGDEGCWEGDLNFTIQQLLTKKDAYFGIRYLKLAGFPQLVEIWNKNPQEILNFKKLVDLEIFNCCTLRYLLTPSMASSLVVLKTLKVNNCKMMEQIITKDAAMEVAEKSIILPQLDSIFLASCSNLTSFCVRSYKLACPSLKKLNVIHCPKMVTFSSAFSTEQVKEAADGENEEQIGKKDTNIAPESFLCDQVEFSSFVRLNLSSMNMKQIFHKQLSALSTIVQSVRTLILKRCGNLNYLFTSSMIQSFVQLEYLTIFGCKKLKEVIVIDQGLAKEERLLFPKLKSLTLVGLPELTKFCSGNYFVFPCLTFLHICKCPLLETFISTSAIEDTSDMTTSKRVENSYTSPLFDKKVAFPSLEDLQIHNMRSLKKIWDDQLDAGSFYKLEYLDVGPCEKLLNIFPVSMLGRLQNLDKMKIKYCGSLEEIFEPHGLSVSEPLAPETAQSTLMETAPNFVFLEVTCLVLQNLPNLKCLYPHIHTTEWPSMKRLVVFECNQVQILASEIQSYQRMSRENQLEIQNQYPLFWVKKATFPLLEELIVERNDNMKEIWHGDDVKDDTVFTKLKCLQLKALPSLVNFCSGSFNFEFPSLKHVVLMKCPNMLTFSGGKVSTPELQKVELTENEDEGCWEGGLNPTIQLLFRKKSGDDSEENWSDTLHKLLD